MTSNPPPSTRSITNDDRLAALEVSSHSLRKQVDSQREELTGICEHRHPLQCCGSFQF